jgi:putative glutamine amidotransferase
LILVVGRYADEATGVRGAAFAAGRGYFHGVQRAGGVPLMLPPITDLEGTIPSLLARVNGVVMHGGGDIDPRRYGQDATAEQLYGIVHEHDEVELAVLREALRRDLPVLAICRGMQVLNVLLGGTLLQDIGSATVGSEDHWHRYHEVGLDAGCRIAKAMGTDQPVRCHSVHHQAVDVVANGLDVVGRSADGVLEAVELRDATWVVGTQWHPEDSAADDPQQQGLFDELLIHAS